MKKVVFSLSVLVIMMACLSCSTRTYYEYLKESPLITTDKKLAIQKQIVAKKTLNDTVFYYYTEGRYYQTSDYETAKKGFIITIKNLKNRKPIGKQVCLDGLGDTMGVSFYDRNHLDSLHISYFGNQQIKMYHEYKEGIKDGVAKYYYPNGNLQQVTHWESNAEQGEYLLYYPNGNIKEQGNYNRGVKLMDLF